MPWHWKWFGCLSAVCSSCTRAGARDYMRAYVTLAGENEGGATALQKQEIEEQKVEQKKHRDALDFSLKWVQSRLLHLCTRPDAQRK
jgi:hypothetical protein